MGTGHTSPEAFPGPLQLQGQGKSADVLLVLCTDPVLEETLLAEFRSAPLWLWRLPGPTIPPSGSGEGEVDSLLQEALHRRGVKEIIVCGHLPSQVLRSPQQASLPEAAAAAIDSLHRLVKQKHGRLSPSQFHQAVVEENVLLQLANLRTYPAVLAAMAGRRVRLHGWIYDWQEEVLYVRGPGESSLLRRTRRFVAPTAGSWPYYDPCDIYLA